MNRSSPSIPTNSSITTAPRCTVTVNGQQYDVSNLLSRASDHNPLMMDRSPSFLPTSLLRNGQQQRRNTWPMKKEDRFQFLQRQPFIYPHPHSCAELLRASDIDNKDIDKIIPVPTTSPIRSTQSQPCHSYPSTYDFNEQLRRSPEPLCKSSEPLCKSSSSMYHKSSPQPVVQPVVSSFPQAAEVLSCPLVEVSPGVRVPYFGAAFTTRAIANQDHISTTCLVCDAYLSCMFGVEYVACPNCHAVSPVDERITMLYPQPPMGLGIGLQRPKSADCRSQRIQNHGPTTTSTSTSSTVTTTTDITEPEIPMPSPSPRDGSYWESSSSLKYDNNDDQQKTTEKQRMAYGSYHHHQESPQQTALCYYQ
ncbi:expressed unknown protein [Seminavis robusta]|uniref:Uncharacterized protein n=1 Tax=Seminavis robusta TaxID=568900 RepID=A0A9N8EYW1_9STRA|nr:expressed unknown protein [Seminavis robusta]|eukprot:Sro2014_g311000.1 n/a (364) ;mRNA; r:2188-3279